MIPVFRFVGGPDDECVLPEDPADSDALFGLDGTSRKASWTTSIHIKTVNMVDDRSQPLEPTDMPYLGEHALVLRPAAMKVLGSSLASAGELLELSEEGRRLWLFNVCTVVDALDEAASEVERYGESGRIMLIHRHVFRDELLKDLMAFRPPQVRTLFVTEPVVEAAKDLQIGSPSFAEVWPRPYEPRPWLKSI